MTTVPHERAVGSTPLRPDGADKVSGRSLYVDDLQLEELWHGWTVRSPHASARILEIDASRALEDPAVRVVTARDVPAPNIISMIDQDWPVLAAERVNHVAEAVALVAAPTRERARKAAEAIEVRYAEQPAIVDLDAALATEARGDPVRVLCQKTIRRGDLEAGFAQAAHVVEGIYASGHQEHAYIEPQGMIAIPHAAQGQASESLEVVGSLQCPYYVHKALVTLFGDNVRVRQAVTGGGFGGKEDYPSLLAAHACLLARATGKPVKIVYDRHEDIVATTKRHPARIRHRTGVAADGTLLAMQIEVLFDGGAYVTLTPVVMSRGIIHAGGAYRCPNVEIAGRALATNTAPNGAFRGFGAPQTTFAVERQIDKIARVCGLDPLTVRERNAYTLGDVTPTGQTLTESVSALECLRLAELKSGFRDRWNACEAQRATAPDDGQPRPGIGLALAWHGTGFTGNGERLMRSPVRLRATRQGTVEVLVSSTDFGQGTTIVLAQIVADAVGVDTGRIVVVEPDTDRVPDSGPTVASRTVMVVGSVLDRAGRALARELCARVAALHGVETARLEEGWFLAAKDRRLARFEEGLARVIDSEAPLEIERRYEPDDQSRFDDESYQGDAYAVYGWGVDVVELEVDPDTLAVRPTRATLVCDVGKAIHPVLCAGQVEGGTLQALGHAYMEEIKLERGRYLNDSLSTYVIPTTLDTPAMQTFLIENPSPVGPQGAKGVGEIPMDAGAAALVQAIESATGITPTTIPATPEVLLADLAAGKLLSHAAARFIPGPQADPRAEERSA